MIDTGTYKHVLRIIKKTDKLEMSYTCYIVNICIYLHTFVDYKALSDNKFTMT